MTAERKQLPTEGNGTIVYYSQKDKKHTIFDGKPSKTLRKGLFLIEKLWKKVILLTYLSYLHELFLVKQDKISLSTLLIIYLLN